MSQPGPDKPNHGPDMLEVEAQTHRRTVLLELRGELDIATVSQVTQALDGLVPGADGVRHIVVDLRGLTFMDASGLNELIRRTTTPTRIGTTPPSSGDAGPSSDRWP